MRRWSWGCTMRRNLQRFGISHLEPTPELEQLMPVVFSRTKGFIAFVADGSLAALEYRLQVAVRSAYIQGVHDMADVTATLLPGPPA